MKLGGLVGTLTLGGDLSPVRSLLRAAAMLHAGKGATVGLGKVKVAPLAARRFLSEAL
jgi:CRISPR-associated endoribonuclease Cas6